jgi:glutaredoxin
MAELKVYGADWCEHTQQILSHLDDLGVSYKYVNIEDDERAAAWVRHQNDGKEKKPTVDVGGIILLAPSEAELDDVLRDAKLIPESAER